MVATANEGKKDQSKVKKEKEIQKGHTKAESSNFAILYNNFFFLFVFFVIGFYFFSSIPPMYNYPVSVAGSSLLVAFVSQQALKR